MSDWGLGACCAAGEPPPDFYAGKWKFVTSDGSTTIAITFTAHGRMKMHKIEKSHGGTRETEVSGVVTGWVEPPKPSLLTSTAFWCITAQWTVEAQDERTIMLTQHLGNLRMPSMTLSRQGPVVPLAHAVDEEIVVAKSLVTGGTAAALAGDDEDAAMPIAENAVADKIRADLSGQEQDHKYV